MRRAAILVSGLALAASAGAGGDDIATRVFERASSSVVTVEALDESGRREAHGSGIALGASGVVTNCHVIRDARGLRVRQGKTEREARWLRADPARDLCLLDVPGLDLAPARRRESRELAVGERVFAVGNPLGFELSVSEGLIAVLAPVAGGRRIFTSAALSPGSSGGGLFDSEGRLVGITTSVMDLGQNLNVALPAEWIGELATRGSAPPADPPPPPAERNWQAEAEALQLKGDWPALEFLALRWTEAMPDAQRAWQQLGLAQLNRGQLAAAETSQRAALARFERDVSTLVELAQTLNSQQRKQEAEGYFREAMRVAPGLGYPHHERGRMLFNDGLMEDAKQEIEEALRLTSNNAMSWGLLGHIEEKMQHPEAAARAFRIALRHKPGNAEFTTGLARNLTAAGRSDQARSVIAESGAQQGDTAAWNNLGAVEYGRKRFTDAENAYRKALEIDPRSVDAWNNLALLQLATGRPRDAGVSLDRAFAVAPDHLRSLLLRGEAHQSMDNPAEARKTFERLVALDAKNVSGLRWLGRLQFAAGDFAAALATLRRLVELPGASGDDWLALGNACVRLRHYDEAESALRKAGQLAPDNVGVPQALAALHGNRGDNLRALDYTRRLIELAPGAVESWSGHGYALTRLGRYDEAVKALETAVRLQPDFANAWINLGQALLLHRQLGKAIQVLEKAVQLAPRATDAQLYLAQAYLGSRQYAQARRIVERMLAQQPGAPAALGLDVVLKLAEGRPGEARASFQQLRMHNAFAASTLRRQAIAMGVPGAATLPE